MIADEYNAVGGKVDWALIRRILHYVWPFRRLAALGLVLSIITAGAGQSLPYLQRLAIDRYLVAPDGSAFVSLESEKRVNGVAVLSLFYFCVAFAEFLGRFGFQYTMSSLAQRVLLELRCELFGKIQSLPQAYFDRTSVGRLMARVTSDVDIFSHFITNGVITLSQACLILVAVLVYMFILDARLALLALVAVPLIYLTTVFFESRLRNAHRAMGQHLTALVIALNENVVGMAAVQLFNREARNLLLFDNINRRFLRANMALVGWVSVYAPTVTLISDVALTVVAWYGGVRTLHNAITVGTLFAFVQYVRSFFQPLQDLSEVFNGFQAAMVSAERIFGILDEERTVADPDKPQAVARCCPAVELDNVWFSYSSTDPVREEDWVLRGITLKLRAGESVALVGRTGSGKTSVINLLPRLYDVQRGSVRVGGADVRDVRQCDLRRHVGVVFQEPFLFSGSIESNIRCNKETISLHAVKDVCRKLGIHEMIERLPQGYFSDVRERGTTLSAGQKQLLAFARACVVDPALLVLDEATANLDTETECLLRGALATLTKGRTSIIVAHRLSTIQHCDRIVVLRHGQIVEEGTHDGLMARKGYYSALCEVHYDTC